MTVAVCGILVALVTAAVTGYRLGYQRGRYASPPRPVRPTLDGGQVRVIERVRAFDWERDG